MVLDDLTAPPAVTAPGARGTVATRAVSAGPGTSLAPATRARLPAVVSLPFALTEPQFVVVGGLFAVWAVVLAFSGLRRHNFPLNQPGERTVMAVSALTREGFPDLLARCLAALARQSLPASEFEIVVADDSASEQIRQQVESIRTSGFNVRYVPVNGRHGPAAAFSKQIGHECGYDRSPNSRQEFRVHEAQDFSGLCTEV